MGKALPFRLRNAVEAEIEQHLSRVEILIARLDRIDPDPDLEDDDPDTSVEDDPRGFDPETDVCEAGDDGCGFHMLGGHSGWGADSDEDAV
ncbi:hypothetical protein [Sphingomonas baiyangensis]|uniref:Uncharacterized protein n=1 Tax=Sphingomonas baiyangensis TaxID=2572576 RepID=A0A4U1L548_9SPHN|nr:hypothetical protein [Sphingomonas baiyangensis]TKD52061.1 hypothetical protein FBR43_15960 [Sphingomonas baiyangensis]